MVKEWINVQFSSVAQSCPTLCNPMNRSMPGLPVITNSWSSLKLPSNSMSLNKLKIQDIPYLEICD